MGRNLVICFDGTGNEFGTKNSNVVKLCQILTRDPNRQLVFYNPGIGTSPKLYVPTLTGRIRHWINNLWDQATGRGVTKNARRGYLFLMNEWRPGDQIFIFGFSRGAYTARVLAAMIHKFGIIDKGNDLLVDYAMTLLLEKTKENDKLAKHFSEAFGLAAKIHFLGVWDSVSSVRWFADPRYVAHTRTNRSVSQIRHAVAIDECRAYFRTNLFSSENKDLKEVWFAGAHADIGGGYSEQESGLSKISLSWIIREAEAAGLICDESDKDRVLGGHSDFASPSPLAQIHDEMRSRSNLWGAAEYLPKLTWDSLTRKRIIKWPLGRSRGIAENSLIHQSVFDRSSSPTTKYQPKNLPKNYGVEK